MLLNRIRFASFAALTLWLTGSLVALWAIDAYKATPGGAGATPPRDPERPGEARQFDCPRLMLFLHPQCPCSQASLTEFMEVVRGAGPVSAEVLFVLPPGVPRGWEQSSLHSAALRLDRIHIRDDAGGVRARKYGAQTSGHVVLYDAQGKLLFSGGITRSRGHAGDNAGRRTLQEALSGQAIAERQFPVFGCPLLSAEPKNKAPGGQSEEGEACCIP